MESGFASIPRPWLTSVASRGSSLKSDPALDAEGVPGACHADFDDEATIAVGVS